MARKPDSNRKANYLVIVVSKLNNTSNMILQIFMVFMLACNGWGGNFTHHSSYGQPHSMRRFLSATPTTPKHFFIHESKHTNSTTQTLTSSSSSSVVSSTQNIVYIKIPKCASSTTGGVARTIAAHQGLSGYLDEKWIEEEPGVWANHNTLIQMTPQINRLHLPTFLFSVIRDPFARCLSAFYFFDVPKTYSNTVADKFKKLKSYTCRNYVSRYLTPTSNNLKSSFILSKYNFMGTTSLFDESMILLAKELSLSYHNVLYMSSKDHNNIAHVGEPKEIKDFESSETWLKNNNYDYELLTLVTRNIELKFEENIHLKKQLIDYQLLNSRVHASCSNKTGKCYWHDSGCGYVCMEKVVARSVQSSS
jgi:hypothetical protein